MEEKKQQKRVEKKQEEPKRVCYIGKTIPGVADYGTVYVNGIPKKLEERVEKNKFMEKLLVPVENMGVSMALVRKKGSPLNILHEKSGEVE